LIVINITYFIGSRKKHDIIYLMSAKISHKNIEQFLHRIWAFELLTPAHLSKLANLVVVRKMKARQTLWLQGQQVTYFTIVYEGKLRCVRLSSAGNEKLVTTLSRGYHFGLAEIITGVTSTVTLGAVEPSVILAIDYKPFKKLLLNNGEICFRLMQTMARAIFQLTSELERASFENVHTRLARLLLKGSLFPSELFGPEGMKKNISHQDLAIQIGVSRETISRTLSDFKRKGLIETGYRSVTVLDRDGLMGYIDDFDQW